jgi:hypothetical protein
VVVLAVLPPGPVQVSVNIVVASTLTTSLPVFTGLLPVQFPPPAEHDSASALVQFKVVDSPSTSVDGEADNVTVGAAAATFTAYKPNCCCAAGCLSTDVHSHPGVASIEKVPPPKIFPSTDPPRETTNARS